MHTHLALERGLVLPHHWVVDRQLDVGRLVDHHVLRCVVDVEELRWPEQTCLRGISPRQRLALLDKDCRALKPRFQFVFVRFLDLVKLIYPLLSLLIQKERLGIVDLHKALS